MGSSWSGRGSIWSGGDEDLSIDDVLRPLSELTTAEIRLASNLYRSGNAGISLMAATGEVYRLVGMKIENGNGSQPRDSR